jgi:hypothetical protein
MTMTASKPQQSNRRLALLALAGLAAVALSGAAFEGLAGADSAAPVDPAVAKSAEAPSVQVAPRALEVGTPGEALRLPLEAAEAQVAPRALLVDTPTEALKSPGLLGQAAVVYPR